jgi:hypothetical protein
MNFKMKSRTALLLAFLLLATGRIYAQVADTIFVNGDLNKFYPVTFLDRANSNNIATELELGRSNVYTDGGGTIRRGSLIAKFRFHAHNWGHGSDFIDADIREANLTDTTLGKFVAGWKDASTSNSGGRIIIWLRGSTTYYYRANSDVAPVIYDGVQNALPYQQPNNGPAHTYKTIVDAYVNQAGISYANTAYFNGTGTNYFSGNVGIGTVNPKAKLSVNGEILSKRVKVTMAQADWPDYVFAPGYSLPSLAEVEKYVNSNRHLPGVPSAREVEKEGLDLGEMNRRLLEKVEELTLYIIQLNNQNQQLKNEIEIINSKIK